MSEIPSPGGVRRNSYNSSAFQDMAEYREHSCIRYLCRKIGITIAAEVCYPCIIVIGNRREQGCGCLTIS